MGTQVDVLLTRDEEQIACEIAVKSPLTQEVQNIRKCVEAGISKILVISPEQKHLNTIAELAEQESLDLQFVSFLTEIQVIDFFANMQKANESNARVHKGWKARSKMKKPDSLEENSTRRSIIKNEVQKPERSE